ncbi:MAG: TolC family protein, partial [Lysobacter sp.]|nr:TolC family protein [Lysobacter sp.]
FAALAARLPETMAQRSALLEADAIAARRRVAVSSAKPDVTVSLGVRRLEAVDDQALVMSVAVPLGSRPRASLAIAEADAQLDALQARRDAQRAEAHQGLFATYQELVHARTEYDALNKRMLPKAEQAHAFTRRGFQAGRFSFLALTQAQRTLFDLRARRVEAAARYHVLLVEVERLTTVTAETTP